MNERIFEKLLWIDLEYSSLALEQAAILEAGVIISDAELSPLASVDLVIHQPSTVIEAMQVTALTPVGTDKPELAGLKTVYDLHASHGLIEAMDRSTISQDDAETSLIELVNKHFTNEKPILAGNSIFFDRTMIRLHWPTLYKLLHYRSIDVSSFKLMYLSRGVKPFEKTGTHRALDDIRASIAELKYYLSATDPNRVEQSSPVEG